MVAIRIQQETYDTLTGHLMAAAPEETGTLALLGACHGEGPIPDLVVRELLPPESDEWEGKGEDWLTPTTSYLNRAAVAADRLHLGVAFIHSHPNPNHPAGLSAVDRHSTRKMFSNMGDVLGRVPLASLVFTSKSFAGVAIIGGGARYPARVDRLKLIGGRLHTVWASDSVPESLSSHYPDVYSRQILAFGEAGQAVLSKLNVAIVGAGGTGSAIAEQLVRLGVQHLTLIDDDVLEASNLSRVYGATSSDVRRSRMKVDVVARHLKKISPEGEFRAIGKSVLEPAVQSHLGDADFVFGCTDTDGSRAALNDLALRSFVPVIDTGCRIDVRNGGIRGVYGRVRYLRPGLPCLWCTGTIDGRRVLQESLSPEERERLAASGYGSGIGPQPSVIHLTTLVASLAVSEFLSIAVGAGPPSDGSWLSVSLTEPFLRRVISRVDPTCRCHDIIGLGRDGMVLR